MRYRVIFLIPVFLLLVLVAGCWNLMELEKRAIVSGVAIDKTDDGLLEVTCQVIKPGEVRAGTSAEKGGSELPVLTFSAEGDTLFEALRKLASKAGRKLFFGHFQMLIIGEEPARDGIENILDFFDRDPEPRRSAFMAITPGKAKDLLTVEAGMAKIPAYGIADVIEDSEVNSRAAVVRIRDYSRNISEASIMPVTSRVVLFKDDMGKKHVKAAGTSVFKGYRLVGYLGEKETRGFLWVTGKVEGGIVSAPIGEGGKRIAMEILSASGSMEPEIQGNQITMKIKIEVDGNIGEVDDKDLEINNPENIPPLENNLSEVITGEVYSAISKAKELNTDIFGFGESVRRKHTKEWKNFSSKWDEHFRNTEVVVEVSTKLRDTGKIINPANPVVSFK